jgi:hypothetical protein
VILGSLGFEGLKMYEPFNETQENPGVLESYIGFEIVESEVA